MTEPERSSPIRDAMRAQYPTRWRWYSGLCITTVVCVVAAPFTLGIPLLLGIPTLIAAVVVYMPMRKYRRHVATQYLHTRGLTSMKQLRRQPWRNTLTVGQFAGTGATARVEHTGELRRRITGTRLVTIGVFALAAQKKVDNRTLWLSIEGPGLAEVREYRVGRVDEAALRQFAAEVNAVSAGQAAV